MTRDRQAPAATHEARQPSRLFDILASRARQFPEAPFYFRDHQAVSNREAYDDVSALAAALRAKVGMESSSAAAPVVAAMFEDPYELHRVIWATRGAGICLAFLPTIQASEEVKRQMQQVGATFLLTDLPVFSKHSFALSICDFGYNHVGVPPLGSLDPFGNLDEPAFLLRTSGTTGNGKWVSVRDRQFTTMLEAMRETGALHHTESQVAFLTPPLSHSYGLSSLLEYLHAGSAVVFPRGTSPLGPAGELRDKTLAQRVTAIEGVPDFYGQLARLLPRLPLSGLRHVGFGGGALDRQAVERLGKTFPDLTCSIRYGLTETPSIVSGRVFRPVNEPTPNSGQVLPIWDVRIVDPEGHVLPEGQEGEIELRGPCLAWPYFEDLDTRSEGAEPARKDRREDDGRPASHGNIYFPTGDLGVLRNGQLSILGRKSFFIKKGGYRFSPEEVEAVLRRFEGVVEARVFLGDGGLTAEVVSEVEDLSETDLRAFAADRLPAYAVPQELIRVERIPRTESGKILRHPGSRAPRDP